MCELMHLINIRQKSLMQSFKSYPLTLQSPHPSDPTHRRWEGGDPGVANQKSPTSLLLTPELRFHSLGFAARDSYHDLDPEEARHWLYFDKFKMKIHSTSVSSREQESTEGK